MLGIDVSKASLSCTLLDQKTRKILWSDNFANSPDGWSDLLKRVDATHPWVLEPTGRYSHGPAKEAILAGRSVLLAPPKRAQLFLQSVQHRAKTDKLDSHGLALFALAVPLAPFPIKNDMQETLDQLLLARKGLSQARRELQLRFHDLPRAATNLQPAIDALSAQIKVLDKQIKELCKSPELEATKALQQIPGFGPVVAATLVSRLTAKSFDNSGQFVAYCGLDIRVLQSGRKSGNAGLSKQGDAELRRLLYLAAQASLRAKDSPFALQYQRERDKGLPSSAALCAVARKMARLAWSMVKNGTTYDSERVYSQPPQKFSRRKRKNSTV